MKINPQVAAHYQKIKSASGSSLQPGIKDLRISADKIYNDNAHFPPVYSVEDIYIPCPWGSLPIRLYKPTDTKNLPILIYYHGGGFCMHNIASHDSLCRKLALDCECAVISVGYRLAPEFPFPAALEDSYSALEWIKDNSENLNLDGSRIALAGDSAGAYLCASVSTLSRDRNGPKISLQILCYGGGELTDVKKYTSYKELINNNPVLSKNFMDTIGSYYQGNASADNPYLNPIRSKDLKNLPRTFSVNAEYDPLRDSGEAYAKALADAGNIVHTERVLGVYHGFLLLWQEFDITREVISHIAKEVKDTFNI